MKESISRDLGTARFRRLFVVSLLAWLGGIATGLQILDIFAESFVSSHEAMLIVLALLVAISAAVVHAWPRPVEYRYSVPNTEIRIVVGDLFSQSADRVIGVCDTFDTDVNQIISDKSVQGQLLTKVYRNDQTRLDADLLVALSGELPVRRVEKPGKKDAYEIGTVAVLQLPPHLYYCVAYTEMSAQNEAQGSTEGLWKSLDQLWRAVRLRSNGAAVAIPVVAGGQSRLSQILPAQDSIRFIALSFMLASRRSKVCDRLDIVVQPEQVAKLDMLELQAFLSSLQPS